MRLFRMRRPVLTEQEITPFLAFWPGEIVRHMGRCKTAANELAVALTGCVVEAGREFVIIQWENDLEHPERITDPSVLVQILKQPRPAFSQL